MARQWPRTAQQACFKKYMGDPLQPWEIVLLNDVPDSTKSYWNNCIENYGLIPMDRKREKSREGTVLTNELMFELRKIAYTFIAALDINGFTFEGCETINRQFNTDVNAAGTQTDITLTLNGPGSVTLSKIDDGIIDLTNVATATVSGFNGALDINAGVETLTTTDSVRIDLDGATDLVTATLDFKNDWDPTLTTAQAAVSAALYSTSYLEDYASSASIGGTDLKTLTITGELLDLYLDEANLETLSIDATMTDLTISSATDLTSLTVASGSLIGSISLTGSNNLTVADFNHTSNMENKGSATANTSVSFVVTDNLGLTKLHTTGDDVSTFTVTGNDALTELDMTGLKDQGGATSATVNVYDNDLTAVSASNTSDGETNKADGASGDAGSFDDGTSGMDTMKVYLTAIAADADNTAQVSFDTVSTETDTETTGTTTTTLNVLGATSVTSTTNEATVLKMIPATANTAAGAKAAIGQIYGMIVTPVAQSNDAEILIQIATRANIFLKPVFVKLCGAENFFK